MTGLCGEEGRVNTDEILVSIHSTTCILLIAVVMTTVGQLHIPVTLFYEL